MGVWNGWACHATRCFAAEDFHQTRYFAKSSAAKHRLPSRCRESPQSLDESGWRCPRTLFARKCHRHPMPLMPREHWLHHERTRRGREEQGLLRPGIRGVRGGGSSPAITSRLPPRRCARLCSVHDESQLHRDGAKLWIVSPGCMDMLRTIEPLITRYLPRTAWPSPAPPLILSPTVTDCPLVRFCRRPRTFAQSVESIFFSNPY